MNSIEHTYLKTFGAQIRYWRIERKVTRKQLGSQIGLSVHRLTQLERGDLDLDILTARKIMRTLAISASILFDDAAAPIHPQ
jgi:transcriptional regulator with XRE-family HTH domain